VTRHSFALSLEKSHAQADAPWWIEVYRAAFPTLQSAVCMRHDGWAQRGGIDRVLVLGGGKTLSVDEKVRDQDWDDILLEFWSDEGRKIPGWIAKDLACDFIAYAFVPSQRCYLLPFQTLRKAWHDNRREWVNKYRIVDAENDGYTTKSVAVPIDVLMAALRDAMKIVWH
jgi:hypothetical protein